MRGSVCRPGVLFRFTARYRKICRSYLGAPFDRRLSFLYGAGMGKSGTFDVSDEDYRFMEHFIKNAVYDDYDRLVQLCDALALPTGFCLLEKRFVDVAIRYGTPPATVDRWKKILEIKEMFDSKTNGSIYQLLPGVIENSFR